MRLFFTIYFLLLTSCCFAQTGKEAIHVGGWLKAGLECYFSDQCTMDQLTTQRYAHYKSDAMNTDMNWGMSFDAFEKKWNHIYNTKQAGTYEGFLIPLQDWHHITVNCRFYSHFGDVIWMSVLLTEATTRQQFRRYVKLMKEKGAFRINDVWEAPIRQNELSGDFNGDGKGDTLRQVFTSLLDGAPLLIDTALDTDRLIAKVVSKKPLLQLVSEGLAPLVLNKNNFYVLGLAYWKNMGDTNDKPGDELAVIIRAADYSSINRLLVYTYYGNRWKMISEKEIREEEIPADGSLKW